MACWGACRQGGAGGARRLQDNRDYNSIGQFPVAEQPLPGRVSKFQEASGGNQQHLDSRETRGDYDLGSLRIHLTFRAPSPLSHISRK